MEKKKFKWLKEDEWKQARKKYITATEAPSILGLNPWKSASKMWYSKNQGSFTGNSYTFIGQLLEQTVVEVTNHVLNRNFKRYETHKRGKGRRAFFVNEDYKLSATPDAYDDRALLECKTTKPNNLARWINTPPLHYVFQVHVQLMCSNYKEAYLAIMSTDLTQENETLTLPLIIYKIKPSEKLRELFLKELKGFWDTIEEGKTPRTASSIKNKAQLLIRTTYEKVDIGDRRLKNETSQ